MYRPCLCAFQRYVPLLVKHRQRIKSNPTYASAELGSLRREGDDQAPVLSIPAGRMLDLWARGQGIVRCQHCGGPGLVHWLHGAPSHAHGLQAICIKCNGFVEKWDDDAPWYDVDELCAGLHSVADRQSRLLVASVVERPGLMGGERVPGVVIPQAPEPVALGPMMDILEGGSGDVEVASASAAKGRASLRATYSWSTHELWSNKGILIARLVPGGVVDGRGQNVGQWDGRYWWAPQDTMVPSFECIPPPQDDSYGLNLVEVKSWHGAKVGWHNCDGVDGPDSPEDQPSWKSKRYSFQGEIPMVLNSTVI